MALRLRGWRGCFTSSFMFSLRATWGIWPQFEFNITQGTPDRIILEAICLFFKPVGKLYDKPNNISVFAVRDINDIKSIIIPFFLATPLITVKNIHFQTWLTIFNIAHSKLHVGNTLSARDYLLQISLLLQQLNSSRAHTLKMRRLLIIINWLQSLEGVPTLAQKLELQTRLNSLNIPNGES